MERLVRRGSQETFELEKEREIRQKWIRAGRFALNSISKRRSSSRRVFTISENQTSPIPDSTKSNNEFGTYDTVLYNHTIMLITIDNTVF